VQTGSSLNQLSSKFGFPKTTIYYHVKEFCRKMNKFDEKRLSEWERGYLVGFFVGDGCLIYRPKCWSYITKFVLNALTEKAIANSLINILSKAGVKPWTTTEGHRLKVLSSSKGLQYFVNYRRSKQRPAASCLNDGTCPTITAEAGTLSRGSISTGVGSGHPSPTSPRSKTLRAAL